MPRLEEVPERFSFPKGEEEILEYWKQNDTFHESVRLSEGRPPFSFYDGPPFATGLPHYGHILAGTIKDVVCRYAHQTGHHVPRRFGWDCHGLPVEFEIDKKLDVKGRQDVLDMGIATYNDECRAIVGRYTKEWEVTVGRVGRWIDFSTGYRTMDLSYMETVWWVFQQLHEKGYVYRGFKVRIAAGCPALRSTRGTVPTPRPSPSPLALIPRPHPSRLRAAAGDALLVCAQHAALQLRGAAKLQGRLRPRRRRHLPAARRGGGILPRLDGATVTRETQLRCSRDAAEVQPRCS